MNWPALADLLREIESLQRALHAEDQRYIRSRGVALENVMSRCSTLNGVAASRRQKSLSLTTAVVSRTRRPGSNHRRHGADGRSTN
jgi:hypothetical protein